MYIYGSFFLSPTPQLYFRGAFWHITPKVFAFKTTNLRQTTQLIEGRRFHTLSALFEKKSHHLSTLKHALAQAKVRLVIVITDFFNGI